MLGPFRKRSEPEASTGADFSPNYRSFSAADNVTSDPLNTSNYIRGAAANLSPPPVRAAPDFRGFSTSIHDMFSDPSRERVDCCALTCCGVMQSDRDRYLIQGVTPPGPFKRCVVHIVFPCCIFLVAGLAAVNISDARLNQAVSTGMILLLLIYLLVQCYKGRRKRTEMRKDILWLKYLILNNRGREETNILELLEKERPDAHGESVVNDEAPEYYLGQTSWDIACAHPFCIFGLYNEDRFKRSSIGHVEAPHRADNFCSRLWVACCSPGCWGMHLQVCGTCATAQEAREIESVLLPASYRRIDYITMQPITAYYPEIYKDRWEQHHESSLCCFSLPTLSRLSQRLLQSLGLLTVGFLVWCIAGPYFYRFILQRRYTPPHLFGILDFIVYIATWVQAIGLLTLIVCFVNRLKNSELSVDAIIKYFASGFVLSTSLAVFWEVVISVSLRLFIQIAMIFSGTELVDRQGYNMAEAADGHARWTTFGTTFLSRAAATSSGGSARDFLEVFGNDHPVFYTFIIFVNAFLVAAVIEEMCKYFGYRMVEHPDFFTKEELEDTSRIVTSVSDEDGYEGEDGGERNAEESQKTSGLDYSQQRTSLQSQASAITLAMVSVAMGFTCCENLVYIFKYTGSSAGMELTVLISRSFFPIHPIAAAMQSVGVCARDLEANRNVQLGTILLPVIIFHGFYDFFILWIDFLARRNGVYTVGGDDDSYTEEGGFIAILSSFLVSVLIMTIALVLLYTWSRKQRQRLADMDVASSVDRSRLI